MASTRTLAKRRAASEIDARRGIARQDLATAFARIFTPRVRGRRLWIETIVVFRGVTIEIAGPELDSTDLGVLLAVLSIAQSGVGETIAGGECGGLLLAAQQKQQVNAAAAEIALRVCTSVAEIALALGRDARDGDAGKMIRRSLTRMMGVVLSATRGAAWGVTHLLHAACERGGEVTVALNYRATRAVTGVGQWATIDMQRFAFATQLERVLMHRLAALCVGHPLDVSVDRLVETCWTRPAGSPAEARVRRQRVRRALPHCLPDGVRARIDEHGVVRFFARRPKGMA